ncbi:hypothetical protein D3C80_1397470 [compost metagenome]
MAEQLGFQQVGRDRRAVEFDKRPLAAHPVKMQGAGYQLLAGAGLAFYQHRRQVAAGHAPLGVEQLADGVLEAKHGR